MTEEIQIAYEHASVFVWPYLRRLNVKTFPRTPYAFMVWCLIQLRRTETILSLPLLTGI
jgi:hypothetical protein